MFVYRYVINFSSFLVEFCFEFFDWYFIGRMGRSIKAFRVKIILVCSGGGEEEMRDGQRHFRVKISISIQVIYFPSNMLKKN